MSRILFLIAGAILALLDSPSVAAPVEPPSRIVHLGDLDLSTEAGRDPSRPADRRRGPRRVRPGLAAGSGRVSPKCVECRSETFARVARRPAYRPVYMTELALR
jgi:UrcA family protein